MQLTETTCGYINHRIIWEGKDQFKNKNFWYHKFKQTWLKYNAQHGITPNKYIKVQNQEAIRM